MANILISVGSNINRKQHINNGIAALKTEFGELVLSSVYESEAVGFSGDAFYNLVVAANTEHSVDYVVTKLKQIEDDNGRIRKCEKFSARTLDLDLLVFDDLICDSPTELPRDEITKNAFVLWPLAEIAAEKIHPILQQSYLTLWQQYDKSTQHLKPIAFEWATN